MAEGTPAAATPAATEGTPAPAATPAAAATPATPATPAQGTPTLATPAPATPAAGTPEPTTLAGGKEPVVAPATTPADWPADWRDRIVGEDKAALKQLERLGSPLDLFKSYKSLQARLSSGQLKAMLPDNATPEQIAEYRKDNGVPEKPEGYVKDLKLPGGVIPGEADKPLLESFAKTAHDNNWTPDQYSQALGWYYTMQDALTAQRAEADDAYKVDAMTELTTEWGREYKANINALGNLMALFPQGAADLLFGGRTADGRLVGDHPAILRGLVAIARELNPAATLLPAGTGGTVGDVNTRIGELNKLMRDNGSSYWNKETGPALQAEYRSLVEAQQKIQERTGRAA